jgi:hypothetical protein
MFHVAYVTFGALSGEAIALVVIGGCALGLTVAVVMLLVRRPPPPPQQFPIPRFQEAPAEPDPVRAGTSLSRRAAPRRGGRLVDVLITDETCEMEPFRAWVIDRSAGGLAIGAGQPFAVGTILSVRPLESSQVPWVQIEIRDCQVDGSDWRLCCKFVRTPPYSTLMLFG